MTEDANAITPQFPIIVIQHMHVGKLCAFTGEYSQFEDDLCNYVTTVIISVFLCAGEGSISPLCFIEQKYDFSHFSPFDASSQSMVKLLCKACGIRLDPHITAWTT